MEKFPHQQLYRLGSIFAIAAILVLLMVGQSAIRSAIEDDQMIVRSTLLVDSIDQNLSLLVSVENGEAPRSVSPVEVMVASTTSEELLQLRSSISRNGATNAWLAEMNEVISREFDLVQRCAIEGAGAVVDSGVGDGLAAPGGASPFSSLEDRESRLIAERSIEAASSRRLNLSAAATGTFGALALLAFCVISLYRTTSRPAVESLGLQQRVLDLERDVDGQTSERRQVAHELGLARRSLRVLTESSLAIIHAESEQELLDTTCAWVTTLTGHPMAWIGFAEFDKAKTIKPIAQSGLSLESIRDIGLRWSDEGASTIVGSAIQTGQSVVVNDVGSDARFVAARERAIAPGAAAVLSVPFLEEQRPLGALTVYSNEVGVFSTAEVDLLNLLGQNLSFGISALRTRETRRRVGSELEAQLLHQRSLREIDLAVMGTTDVRITLNVILEQVVTQMKVSAADILLLNADASVLTFAAGNGFRSSSIERTMLSLGDGVAGLAAFERRIVSVPDLQDAAYQFARKPRLQEDSFVSMFAVPLITKGEVKGVLEVFLRVRFHPDGQWLGFLQDFADQAAIAIDSSQLFEKLQRTHSELLLSYDTIILGWSRALDLRDNETEGHSQRVTEMAMRVAQEYGVPESQLVHVRRGALLHDIGKVAIPDAILFKPQSLTEPEWSIMRRHPVYAHELLWPIVYLREALDIPYCHHERWDGTGYPRGLKGEEIPLSARLFAVVDVWDALLSDRPYRQGWERGEVMRYVAGQAGSQFDPEAVAAFLRVIENQER